MLSTRYHGLLSFALVGYKCQQQRNKVGVSTEHGLAGVLQRRDNSASLSGVLDDAFDEYDPWSAPLYRHRRPNVRYKANTVKKLVSKVGL